MQHLEFKANFTAGDAGQIAGYASLFGRPADAVRDIVEPGAFKASLMLRMPEMKAEHAGPAIGAWDEVVEDEMGLRVKGRLNLDNPAGRAVYADVIAGRKGGLSIGYVATKSAKDASGARVLAQVDLHEISIVRNPASNRTRILSVKNMEGSMPGDENGAAVDTAALEVKVADLDKAVKSLPVVDLKPFTERLDKIEAKMNRPGLITDTGSRTLEQKAFETFLRKGRDHVPEVEQKALVIANDAQAGYLVAPEPLLAEILKTVTLYSPVRQVARVTGISSGGVKIPRRTSAPAAQWVDETEDRPETTAAYGQLAINVHEAAVWVDVSQQLLEDSAFNLEGELSQELALAFAKLEATAFVSGDGVGKPSGFMADSSVTDVANGHASALQADGLIDLYHGIPSAYAGSAVWAMNRKTMGTVRKLKASDGTYLWTDSLSAGNPPTILGRPVLEFADLADVGANARPIAFGDFGTAYRIFDRVALTIMRDPYSQATKGIVRFHARRRVGGAVVMGEALRTLKIATTV